MAGKCPTQNERKYGLMVHIMCKVDLVVLFSLRLKCSCYCFLFEYISPGLATSIRNWGKGLNKEVSG